jgi:hypothetical protein
MTDSAHSNPWLRRDSRRFDTEPYLWLWLPLGSGNAEQAQGSPRKKRMPGCVGALHRVGHCKDPRWGGSPKERVRTLSWRGNGALEFWVFKERQRIRAFR